ncbi:glucose-6-phosphate isomerase [Planctomycetota bacterium]|nr:glucose-6-phosphate isomerase [Planctomycetota bacterium]
MSITLDYTNCLAEAISPTHGLIQSEVKTLIDKIPAHHANLEEQRSNGESGFWELPYQDTSELTALLKKHQGRWDHLVVCGTGGSVLTPRSLFGALAHRHHNELDPKARKGAPKVHFLSSADPLAVSQLLGGLDLKKTLFQVNSRSGSTAEAVAQTLLILEVLKKKAGKTSPSNQLVIVTELEKSPLFELARLEKCDTLHFPANVSGRFSVLGNNTLFMAGLSGISVPALLKGGAAADQQFRHGEANANPGYMHALLHYLLTRKRRKTIHATFPFSERLGHVATWYNHLVAVSLGKMNNRQGKAVHVGPSPESAVGTFDLHGQQQLHSEGPFDKVVTFITVRDHGSTQAVPASPIRSDGLSYVGGADLATLVEQGHLAAEEHLTSSGRPSMNLILDTVDEAHVIGLYHLLMLSAVMSAELYGIDPFDQPSIEHAKAGIFAQTGRSGFEDRAKKLRDYRARPRRRTVERRIPEPAPAPAE